VVRVVAAQNASMQCEASFKSHGAYHVCVHWVGQLNLGIWPIDQIDGDKNKRVIHRHNRMCDSDDVEIGHALPDGLAERDADIFNEMVLIISRSGQRKIKSPVCGETLKHVLQEEVLS